MSNYILKFVEYTHNVFYRPYLNMKYLRWKKQFEKKKRKNKT